MNKLMLFAVMFLCTMGMASAYSIVTGHVYDGSHTPVDGASVKATCNSFEEDTTSDSLGLYIVNFVDAQCPFNTLVHVEATKDTMSGSNDGLTCASSEDCGGIPIALVDVTIPEFTVIAAGIALVGGIVGFAIMRRRK